ncbi:lipoyl synthase [Candidatus Xenohaliotis californiensis]
MVYKHKNLPKNTHIIHKPEWLKIRISHKQKFSETKSIVQGYKVPTICEEALCPNITECWHKKHASFMIMGAICTRSCAFCNVNTGVPNTLSPNEPKRLSQAIAAMNLNHVVITSVDRDDLNDGGAEHFAKCIKAIRLANPNTTIEILTPDFRNKDNALKVVVKASPDIYNHNIETIPRLHPLIRPSARYFHSLYILREVKNINPCMPTKSGIMVGMGETVEEISQTMDDMRAAKIDFLTIGQYLQPTKYHWPIDRYVTPSEFDDYKIMALSKGFKMVASGPLVRSSYHAGEDFQRLKKLLAKEYNDKSKYNNSSFKT